MHNRKKGVGNPAEVIVGVGSRLVKGTKKKVEKAFTVYSRMKTYEFKRAYKLNIFVNLKIHPNTARH